MTVVIVAALEGLPALCFAGGLTCNDVRAGCSLEAFGCATCGSHKCRARKLTHSPYFALVGGSVSRTG